ncbi:MAG: hypothetical protein IPG89_15940 [Bacteroidetes bacterium]|nr:hypothetical protein [Bacteroidota bacterium]
MGLSVQLVGSTSACAGTSLTYSVVPISGVTNYADGSSWLNYYNWSRNKC